MGNKLPRSEEARNVRSGDGLESRESADRQTERRRALAELIAESVHEGGSRFRIRGHCMTPLLRDGDAVDVEPMAAAPKVGDLLLARAKDDELVCHRLLTLGPPMRLAGDASHRVDSLMAETLIGRVKTVHRRDRQLTFHTGIWQLLALPLGRWHGLVLRHRHRRSYQLLEWPRRLVLRLLSWRWLLARRKSSDSTAGVA